MTGVQTCALPILVCLHRGEPVLARAAPQRRGDCLRDLREVTRGRTRGDRGSPVSGLRCPACSVRTGRPLAAVAGEPAQHLGDVLGAGAVEVQVHLAWTLSARVLRWPGRGWGCRSCCVPPRSRTGPRKTPGRRPRQAGGLWAERAGPAALLHRGPRRRLLAGLLPGDDGGHVLGVHPLCKCRCSSYFGALIVGSGGVTLARGAGGLRGPRARPPGLKGKTFRRGLTPGQPGRRVSRGRPEKRRIRRYPATTRLSRALPTPNGPSPSDGRPETRARGHRRPKPFPRW